MEPLDLTYFVWLCLLNFNFFAINMYSLFFYHSTLSRFLSSTQDPAQCCKDGGRDQTVEACAQRMGLASQRGNGPPTVEAATVSSGRKKFCYIKYTKYLSVFALSLSLSLSLNSALPNVYWNNCSTCKSPRRSTMKPCVSISKRNSAMTPSMWTPCCRHIRNANHLCSRKCKYSNKRHLAAVRLRCDAVVVPSPACCSAVRIWSISRTVQRIVGTRTSSVLWRNNSWQSALSMLREFFNSKKCV